ncbi:hypothetical protein [Hymenobacter psychrotolerans]|uniref:Uncharacterized protein n=1 Tax=Hymenobacter psychrotolerans DSM 18569 TaxID=1121959 RepID=A0A1M6Y2S7_9BACT|nr:hypothetical protein [Hymenobacter psychrotolerans]SHL12498.1 hypothetical protein SAMN02746009_02167 [Hymenobacter psychrotolerans DSM 18569]
MTASVTSPFASARTFVFRPGLVLRRFLAAPAPDPAAQAARQARKRRKKEARHERLRNFFGWCEGCAAYGSIF